MTTRIGRCIKTPALTPYIEDAHQFNSQLGNLLRPALDTPEAIAAERRRTGEPADQHLARALASTSPAEERVLPSGTPVRITRPGQFTAVYLYLHGGGWIIGSARAADLPMRASRPPVAWPWSAWTTASRQNTPTQPLSATPWTPLNGCPQPPQPSSAQRAC